MTLRTLRGPARRIGRRIQPASEVVLSPTAGMRPGTVIGCCASLLVAGVLLARGFVGIVPGRPVYLVMGSVLAGTALLSLVIDHVSVRVRAEAPDHVLVSELDRSRRYGHPLALVAVRADEVTGLRIVSRLRTPDRAWRTGGTLVILLVETEREGAIRFAARLSTLVTADQVRLAAFPEDAVTADGLLSALSAPSPPLAVGSSDGLAVPADPVPTL